MFESLPGSERRGIAKRLLALLLSALVHGVMLMLLIVLPLAYMQVLPGADLFITLIAPPMPRAVGDAPAPQSGKSGGRGGTGAPGEKPKVDFVDPGSIPDHIPAPTGDEPPAGVSVGVPGFGLGFPGSEGLSGAGLVSDLISSPPVVAAPKPPAPPDLRPVRVSSGVQEARLIRRVEPVYPHLPMLARVSGEVVMDVSIDEEGNVAAIKVISGHTLLVDEAVRAVRQWKYSPTLLNGEPVPVICSVRVVFKLR